MEIKVKPWVRFFANYIVPKKNLILVKEEKYKLIFSELLESTLNKEDDWPKSIGRQYITDWLHECYHIYQLNRLGYFLYYLLVVLGLPLPAKWKPIEIGAYKFEKLKKSPALFNRFLRSKNISLSVS